MRWGGNNKYAPQGWPVKIDLEFGVGVRWGEVINTSEWAGVLDF